MNYVESYVKDPQAVLDYGLDWQAKGWLGTDTIATSTWVTDDPGITIDSISHDATSTTVWLSGGTLSAIYLLTNHITTAAGREDDRSIMISITER